MFGHNEIVGKKFFKDSIEADNGELLVTSLFYTLQGEGPHAGRCAVFLRLAKCNLNCSFCDTYFDKGEWYSVRDLIEKIVALWPNTNLHSSRLLCITGGEPLLQAEALKPLINTLYASGWDIQVETNGILPKIVGNQVMYVCSPKHSTKGREFVMPHISILQNASALKFVVSADPDSGYHEVPKWASDWAREYFGRIYVSPMNVYARQPPLPDLNASIEERTARERISFWTPGLLDAAQNQANHEHAAKLCLENGFHLCLQTHLYASLP